MIAQRDSRLNFSIATDSHKIAMASRKDSSAMKAIAILTIAFLPATAIATIFSMNPFLAQAPDGSVVISSSFWIYWAVTIPLTVLVFVLWLLWLWRKGWFEDHHS